MKNKKMKNKKKIKTKLDFSKIAQPCKILFTKKGMYLIIKKDRREYPMRKIKIFKTTEEIPLKKGVNLCLQVLEKPKNISKKSFAKQIKEDLISGKKFFRIREITLSEKVEN
jgi:hypothetical protein